MLERIGQIEKLDKAGVNFCDKLPYIPDHVVDRVFKLWLKKGKPENIDVELRADTIRNSSASISFIPRK